MTGVDTDMAGNPETSETSEALFQGTSTRKQSSLQTHIIFVVAPWFINYCIWLYLILWPLHDCDVISAEITSCLTNYSGNALGCMPPQVRRDGEWYPGGSAVACFGWTFLPPWHEFCVAMLKRRSAEQKCSKELVLLLSFHNNLHVTAVLSWYRYIYFWLWWRSESSAI